MFDKKYIVNYCPNFISVDKKNLDSIKFEGKWLITLQDQCYKS